MRRANRLEQRPLEHPRPAVPSSAKPRAIRFHDLRNTTATLLLKARV
ncbi:hypothetical protein VZQ01_32255 [Myxococcus faecalis]